MTTPFKSIFGTASKLSSPSSDSYTSINEETPPILGKIGAQIKSLNKEITQLQYSLNAGYLNKIDSKKQQTIDLKKQKLALLERIQKEINERINPSDRRKSTDQSNKPDLFLEDIINLDDMKILTVGLFSRTHRLLKGYIEKPLYCHPKTDNASRPKSTG